MVVDLELMHATAATGVACDRAAGMPGVVNAGTFPSLAKETPIKGSIRVDFTLNIGSSRYLLPGISTAGLFVKAGREVAHDACVITAALGTHGGDHPAAIACAAGHVAPGMLGAVVLHVKSVVVALPMVMEVTSVTQFVRHRACQLTRPGISALDKIDTYKRGFPGWADIRPLCQSHESGQHAIAQEQQVLRPTGGITAVAVDDVPVFGSLLVTELVRADLSNR